MKKIYAGELRRAIILKAPVETVNDEGGTELSYPTETLATFAKVQEISQGRINEANAITLVNSKDFFIRYATGREAINKDWILTYEGEDYTIHEIQRLNEDKRFIRITAKTKSDG